MPVRLARRPRARVHVDKWMRLRDNPALMCRAMLVYHFINAKFGLAALKNRRLKITRINELNDPFELLGVVLSDPKIQKTMEGTKEELSKDTGILCFCENWKNPLLWSHYADKHKGICLEFEVSCTAFKKVDYIQCRIPWPDNPDKAFMERLLFTKFEDWRYEQEHRVFAELKEKIDDSYYFDFSEELSLKSVIVGCQSDVTRTEISQALGILSKDVEVFKAKTNLNLFDVVREENEDMRT